METKKIKFGFNGEFTGKVARVNQYKSVTQYGLMYSNGKDKETGKTNYAFLSAKIWNEKLDKLIDKGDIIQAKGYFREEKYTDKKGLEKVTFTFNITEYSVLETQDQYDNPRQYQGTAKKSFQKKIQYENKTIEPSNDFESIGEDEILF